MINIADRFRISTYPYGYKVEEHIKYETTEKDGSTKLVDYWGNEKYPTDLAHARKCIVDRIEYELMENDEFIQFTQAVDKMEQLKREIMELSVVDEQ